MSWGIRGSLLWGMVGLLGDVAGLGNQPCTWWDEPRAGTDSQVSVRNGHLNRSIGSGFVIC